LNIETPQEDKIVVDLSEKDMTELDITYENMDYSNIETRRVIWTLLDKARLTLGRDIDPSGRMLIETMPKPTGGCIICFTVRSDKIKSANFHNMLKFKKDIPSATYEFDSLSDLTECAEKIKKSYISLKSSLYFLDGRYRLVIDCGDFRHIRNLVSEYGNLCRETPLFYESMSEHWSRIADGNAVEMLTIGL